MKMKKTRSLCALFLVAAMVVGGITQFVTPAKTVKAEEAVATLKEAVPQYNPEKHKKIEITGCAYRCTYRLL